MSLQSLSARSGHFVRYEPATIIIGHEKSAVEAGLNGNTLKLVAVVAMVLQHVAATFLTPGAELFEWMYMAGKLTAPIMCFFVAEGYYYTSNLRRYALRLLAFALISHIPHALAFGLSPLIFWRATSIMWPLFLGLVALAACKSQRLKPWAKLALVLVCCGLSYPGNFNCIAVLWVLAFGVFREKPMKKWLAFVMLVLLYIIEYSVVVEGVSNPWAQLASLAVIPLLMLYNHRRGSGSKALKWGYYLFYPAHFLVLYGLGMMI